VPSYVQLESEDVWLEQFVPDNLTALLIEPLREFYGMDASQVGAPGDNNHLYGRHRSANWDRQSVYCTDRSYGTTSTRDHVGGQDWYRACDVGIQGQTLYDASHRMDALVRSGQAPGVAEWFGTFDGQNVVGWYEGHPSSSDDSHLWHLHVGLWNDSANDPELMRLLLATITGEDMATPEEIAAAVWKLVWHSPDQPNPNNVMMGDLPFAANKYLLDIKTALVALQTAVDAIDCGEGGGTVDVKAIADAVADELRADPERDGDDT